MAVRQLPWALYPVEDSGNLWCGDGSYSRAHRFMVLKSGQVPQAVKAVQSTSLGSHHMIQRKTRCIKACVRVMRRRWGQRCWWRWRRCCACGCSSGGGAGATAARLIWRQGGTAESPPSTPSAHLPPSPAQVTALLTPKKILGQKIFYYSNCEGNFLPSSDTNCATSA